VAEHVTIADVADRAGVDAEELGRWQRLGLLSSGEHFGRDDVERAGLIRFAVRRGFTPEKLSQLAVAHGDMIGSFVYFFID